MNDEVKAAQRLCDHVDQYPDPADAPPLTQEQWYDVQELLLLLAVSMPHEKDTTIREKLQEVRNHINLTRVTRRRII